MNTSVTDLMQSWSTIVYVECNCDGWYHTGCPMHHENDPLSMRPTWCGSRECGCWQRGIDRHNRIMAHLREKVRLP